MKRSLLVIPAAAALLAGVAIAPAAFPSGAQRVDMHMPMPMAASAAGSAGGATTQLHRAVVRVAIHDFKFQPARLVVSRGTRVIWTNRDSDPHTINSKPAHWSSAALDTGSSFAVLTKRAGTFTYICTIHPFMHGTVIVK
jgi:plastocyanin